MWSTGDPSETMAEGILTELGQLVCNHPWWRARTRLTLALLRKNGVAPPAKVLDAGCGWGTNLLALEDRGYHVTGLDVSLRTLELLDNGRRRLILADLTKPFPDDHQVYDAVLALDVIEHLDDDADAIARLAKLCSPGGLMIVSVPALPELYSEFDSIQGHRRRYTPATLEDAFGAADIDLGRILWWGSWLVPTLRFQRRRSKQRSPSDGPIEIYREYLKLPPPTIRMVLRAAFRIENVLALSGLTRTGTSLLAIGRRPM